MLTGSSPQIIQIELESTSNFNSSDTGSRLPRNDRTDPIFEHSEQISWNVNVAYESNHQFFPNVDDLVMVAMKDNVADKYGLFKIDSIASNELVLASTTDYRQETMASFDIGDRPLFYRSGSIEDGWCP